ncbi:MULTISPECIES: hypothetical protein [Vibrio]|uniref:hypothetical protein n=1 Tax=Vibrio TaxID=662 RepID=UPI000C840050|nr:MULTISPECIES: hypothetical protein [Vibrio]PMI50602.1 hypothetical protein BCU42_09815 [Vibrio splendidus]PMK09150.1 hypothetical protein BCU07_15880 [Vibrio sp. 10N.261.54.E10]
MKYRLGLREITESDIRVDCPFMPEPEDYPMYVEAFVADFNNLEIVDNAFEENNSVVIELAEGVTGEQLRQASISIHQNYWKKLRTTGFDKIA